jgi:hypothetical protein
MIITIYHLVKTSIFLIGVDSKLNDSYLLFNDNKLY